jgi:diacylglycerol kinase family enzyme
MRRSEEPGVPLARSSQRRWVLIVFALAVVGSVWFWRRRLWSALAHLRPYVRRRSRVVAPTLIVNRWSGDGKAEAFGLVERAESLGIHTILLEPEDDLTQLAHDAIDSGADAIGMAGGDGSLGLVAGVAAERDVPFFCVPVGTRNHFALDLGLDRDDPLSALDALVEGDELRIDYGIVGDRVFLNNVSLGVYATAVHRDTYRGEKVRTIAQVLTEAAADSSEVEAIHMTGPDGKRYRRVPLLLVSNNRYSMSGPPDFGRRPRMDGGVLGIAAATHLPDPETVTRVTITDLVGWHEWEDDHFRVDTEDPEILTGVDGEALSFASPLDIRIRTRGLRVLVPAGIRPGYLPPAEAFAARLFDIAAIGTPPSEPQWSHD